MRAEQFGDRAFDDLERNIDLGRDDILIFDLGLGERGLFDGRPHHRLGAAIKHVVGGEFEQFAHDRGLGLIIHRQIRMVPVAADAEALELLALGVNPMLRIGAAFGAELLDRNLVLVELFLAILLLDLPFDRQTVAVPAGHIGRVLALQRLGADDHVLEDMVQRMADVHVAIGVGRAVVEDELVAALAAFANLAFEVALQPFRQNQRLLLRQAGLHREVGLGQEDGVAIVRCVSHGAAALSAESRARKEIGSATIRTIIHTSLPRT